MLQQCARAKINLALHVTGQRADGYHVLDTIVTFAETGDRLTFQTGNTLQLTVTGPYSRFLPADTDNIVLKAAQALRSRYGAPEQGASINLEKNLPVASGIGGGSANAAATLRALCTLWRLKPAADDLAELALSLGADVPMCLLQKPARVTGIGEIIEPLSIAPLHLVLANPGLSISTPDVFNQLAEKENSAIGEMESPVDGWIPFLIGQRNDLQTAATALCPPVQTCLEALQNCSGSRFERMSGSGATCFAVFDSRTTAIEAANRLNSTHPDWWVVATDTVS